MIATEFMTTVVALQGGSAQSEISILKEEFSKHKRTRVLSPNNEYLLHIMTKEVAGWVKEVTDRLDQDTILDELLIKLHTF